MKKPAFGLSIGQGVVFGMCGHHDTIQEQMQIEEFWNKQVQDPLAFIPHELRGSMSAEEARQANSDFGEFVAGFVSHFLANPQNQNQRISDKKTLVAVGYGRGYDFKNFVRKATVAGLRVCLVDVSSVACKWAKADLRAQYEQLRGDGLVFVDPPIVRSSELQHFLENPSFYSVDLDSVEVWYLCRVLNCFPDEASAGRVLQKLGSSLVRGTKHNNRLILVNAFKDDNPTRISKISKLYTLKMILSSLGRGARCPVEIKKEASYQYFSQHYRAIEIGLK